MAEPVASTASPVPRADNSTPSSSTSSATDPEPKSKPTRPKLGSRKSSGTIIVPRDSPHVELTEEEFDEDDARTMSPRRNSEDVEKMGKEARLALEESAKSLQAGLLALVEQLEIVKSSHDKLEQGNEFLQSYIGELMSASKITAAGGPRGKGGRSK
ncbi:MAG: hypothetical protein M1819_002363 [Sarea resinae]|nr:MAG: hypothetical protein M1819_002363 [Sarea resinae]